MTSPVDGPLAGIEAGRAPRPATPSRSHVAALGAAALALTLWSGTTTFNKIAVTHVDGLTVGILRSAGAGLVALVAVAALRLKPPRTWGDVRLVVLSGITSFAVWPALLSVGVARTTAGHAGLVMALIPVLTVLLARLHERRVPRAAWWGGAVLALAATAVLMLGRGISLAPVERGPGLLGDLVVFSGCAVCATGYVAGGRAAPRLGAPAATLWGLIAALAVTLPLLAVLAPGTDWRAVPASAWLAIGYLTLLSSLVGYVLWFFALGRGGVGRIGSLQLAMPVMTLVVAGVLLQERLSFLSSIAAVVLVTGTYIAHRHA